MNFSLYQSQKNELLSNGFDFKLNDFSELRSSIAKSLFYIFKRFHMFIATFCAFVRVTPIKVVS